MVDEEDDGEPADLDDVWRTLVDIHVSLGKLQSAIERLHGGFGAVALVLSVPLWLLVVLLAALVFGWRQ